MVQPALTFPPELLLAAQGIRVAFFDVDGVLTDGGLYLSAEGEMLKRFNILDGLGLQLLQRAGITPVVITGRDSQPLRARLADMSVRLSQSRALLGYTLDVIESGSEAAPLFVLQSRLSSIEAATDVTDLAMKACGGAAFSKQVGVERFFRDARAGWVMAPTADHLRDFIGRALTGLPLF